MKSLRSAVVVLLTLFVAAVSGCQSASDLPQAPLLLAMEAQVSDHLEATYKNLEHSSKELVGAELGMAFGDAAMTYHAYDLPLMARKCYLRAIELDSSDPRWRYLLARVEIELQNLQEARAHLEQLSVVNPDHLATRVALGELQLELNDLDMAKETFRAVLSKNPRCVPALSAMGKIALQQGNPALALVRLEEALNLSPGASGLRYPYGLALRELGRPDEALEQMQARGDAFARVSDPWIEEVRSRPVGARIPLNRGISLFQEGFYAAAEQQFRSSVRSAPESASSHLNLGSALVKLNRAQQAIPEFEEAIRLDPGSSIAWFNLGVIYAAHGDDMEAIHCYDQALLNDSGMHEALFNRANALRRQKRYKESAHEMKKVRISRPGNSLAWLAESVCYLRIDRSDESLKVCRQGRQATANDPRLVSLEGRILASLPATPEDQLLKSLGEIDQLLASEKALEYVETKAMVLAALNRFPQALQWQQAAIEAARKAGRGEIVKRLEVNKALYLRREPARDPWPESDSADEPAGELDLPGPTSSPERSSDSEARTVTSQ